MEKRAKLEKRAGAWRPQRGRPLAASLIGMSLAAMSLAAMCAGCGTTDGASTSVPGAARSESSARPIRVARLGQGVDAPPGLGALRADFERRNPGYGLNWEPSLRRHRAGEHTVVAFVQTGSAGASVERADGSLDTCDPELTVGDIVLLRPKESLHTERPLGALLFEVPDPFDARLPAFVRPDWDDRITDTPGGCAEETGAYRRILLTWLPAIGPYVYRALNCHRVRIMDSFAHYHPLVGGFDEFYLVQMVQPGAVLYTSEATDRILDPASISSDEAQRLLQVHELAVGDLVYLPKGTVHRGAGGVLAQVITVPGFRPGAEIGVDHHLRSINERLGLTGDEALPFRAQSSTSAVVK